MNEIEKIEEERFVESLISLWIVPDAPEWIINYVRTELRKQRGLLDEQENSHETCTGVSSVQDSCNPVVRYIPDKGGWRVGAYVDPSMFEHGNNTGK